MHLVLQALHLRFLVSAWAAASADMTQVNSVMAALQENFHISLFAFVPMLVVIILLILKMPSLPVISFGAGLGIVWGIIFQGLTPVKAISTAWVQLEMNTGIEFIVHCFHVAA